VVTRKEAEALYPTNTERLINDLKSLVSIHFMHELLNLGGTKVMSDHIYPKNFSWTYMYHQAKVKGQNTNSPGFVYTMAKSTVSDFFPYFYVFFFVSMKYYYLQSSG